MHRIPFNRAAIRGSEMEYVSEALLSGKTSGDGGFTRRCRELLESELGLNRVLLTTSCTHALEMAALLLDFSEGDEVIVPSFTFVSTANAFALRGARPVFCDVRADTLNLDERLLDSLVTSRTRAIVPVHYGGIACDMDAIMTFANRHGIAVVEDNAHGLFGKYKGRWLGSIGEMATQSFHDTKNFTCGEGGALLVNDPRLVARAEIIREKGTDRSRFIRGEVDKYSWVDLGSSYLLSDILAAVLYGQFQDWRSVQSGRRRIWNFYHEGLSHWAADRGIGLPVVPEECDQSYHLFYLIMPDRDSRDGMINHLKTLGIQAVSHYLPLHLSEFATRWGGRPGDCPVAEEMSGRLLRLPLYNSLSEAECQAVIEGVLAFDSGPPVGAGE